MADEFLSPRAAGFASDAAAHRGQPGVHPDDIQRFAEWTDEQLDQGPLHSFGHAFGGVEFLVQAGRSIGTRLEDDKEEEDWTPSEFLAARPDLAKVIQPIMENSAETPYAQDFLERFAKQPNPKMAETFIKRFAEQQRRVEQMARHPYFSAAGFGTAVVADIAILSAMEVFTGAAATPTIMQLLQGARNARLATALRAGTFGATDGTVTTGLMYDNDPTMSPRDVALWGTIGGALGAGLGFASAVRAGTKARRIATEAAEVDLMRQYGFDVPTGSAGAAAVADLAETVGKATARGNTPEKMSGSLVARALGQDSFLAKGWRSFGSRIIDRMVKGQVEMEADGLVGNKLWGETMSRIFHVSTFMKEDRVAGAAGRPTTVNANLQQFEQMIIAQERRLKHQYGKMKEDVLGWGATRRLADEAAGRSITALEGPVPERMFTNMINEYRYAHALVKRQVEQHGPILDAAAELDRLKTQILDQAEGLTHAQREKLWGHIERAAPKQEQMMQEIGHEMVAHGMIEADELVEGYTPQLWIAHKVRDRQRELKQLLLEKWTEFPDRTWLNEHYGQLARQADEVGGIEAAEEIKWADDEEFHQFQDRHPEVADEALETWYEGLKDTKLEALEETREALSRQVKFHRAAAETDIEKTAAKNQRKAESQLRKIDFELATLGGLNSKGKPYKRLSVEARARREELLVKRDKIMVRLDEQKQSLRNYDKLKRSASRYETSAESLKRIGSRGQKKMNAAVRAAVRAEKAAIKKVAQAAAKKTAAEEVDGVLKALMGETTVHGHLPKGVLGNTGRVKLRSIFLGDDRFSELIRDITRVDGLDINRSLIDDVGSELAFRKTFGIKEKGRTALMHQLREQALAGFEKDMRKVGNEGAAQIARDRDKAGKLFDEFTRGYFLQNLVPQSEAGRQAAGIASQMQNITAAMALGAQSLSQLTDFALMLFATPGGPVDLVRTSMRGAHMKEVRRALMEADDWETLMLIDGTNEAGLGRFFAINDLNEIDHVLDRPGTFLTKVKQTTRNVAVLEGYANLATGMTRMSRRFFGRHMAMQFYTDMNNWANVPARRKAWYATLGIGSDNIGDLQGAFKKASVKHGKLVFPDRKAWAQLPGGGDLLHHYDRFMLEAGNQAIIAPTRADKTVFNDSAWGRVFAQFTSFMFTAGNRFVKPLAQNVALNPTEARNITSALGALWMSAMGSYARAHVRGTADEWEAKMDSSEGWRDIMWESLFRSPFLVGFTGTYADMIQGWAGSGMNDVTEDLLNIRPFQEKWSRVRTPNFASLATGASASIVGDTVFKTGTRLAQGEVGDAWQQASRRLPILNTFYLQLFMQLTGAQEPIK